MVDSSLEFEEVSTFNVAQGRSLPDTLQQAENATRCDPAPSKTASHARTGTRDKLPEELKPYHSQQHEVGFEGGCLMWGIRVIVPKTLQQCVLESLHETHPGATRMRVVGRSYLWGVG